METTSHSRQWIAFLAALCACETRPGAGDPHVRVIEGSVVLTPTLAARGMEVTVELEVDRVLPEPPRIELRGEAPRAFFLRGEDEAHYAYVLLTQGSEGEGAHDVVATLNELTPEIVLGTVTLDFTPPVASTLSLTAQALAAGDAVTIEVTPSEALREPPALELASVSTLTARADSTYAYDYVATGAEPEGVAALRVRMTDVAGNPSEYVWPTALRFDFTPPSLEGFAHASAEVLARGETLAIEFSMTESLGAVPQVHLYDPLTEARYPLGYSGGDLRALRFNRVIADEPAGLYDVVLEGATDIVGNAAELVTLAHIGVLSDDHRALHFRESPTVTPIVVSRVPGFDRFSVNLVMGQTEGVVAPLVEVSAGALELSCDVASLGTRHDARCTGGPDESSFEGMQLLSVRVSNALGERLEAMLSVVFDFTAPTPLIVKAHPARQSLQAGFDRGAVDATLLEDAAVELLLRGSRQECSSTRARAYECPFSVLASDAEGELPLRLVLTDGVGNASFYDESVWIDLTPPGIVTATLLPEHARPGDEVLLSLRVNEPLGAAPEIASDFAAATATVSSLDFTFLLQVPAVATDGDYPLGIRLVDIAHNPSGALVGPVLHLDSTPPQMDLHRINARRFSAHAGYSTVVLELNANEPLAGEGPSVLLGVRPFVCGPAQSAPPHYTCTYEIMGDEPEGAAGISIHSVDTSGNADVRVVAIVLDFSPPDVDAAVLNGSVFSAQSGHDEVRLDASALEDVALLTASLDASPMTCAAGLCTYEVRGTEGEGSAHIALTATDSVGNNASRELALRLDFSPPLLAAASFYPAIARAGDDLLLFVHPGEPLQTAPALRTVPAALPFALVESSQYVFRYRVVGSEVDGDYQTFISLTDDVGNVATDLPGPVVLMDSRAPTVSAVVVTPARLSRVPGFDELFVSFTISDGTPRADFLDGTPIPCATAHQDGELHVSCPYRVDATDVEGEHIVRLEVRDVAGNLSAMERPVVFDFTAPQFLFLDTDRARYSAIDPFSIITASARLDAAARVTAEIEGRGMACLDANLARPVCTLSVTADLAQGAYVLRMTAVDDVGNSTFADTTLEVDHAAPTLVESSVRPIVARPGDEVWYSVRASESLLVTPVPFVSGPGPLSLQAVPGTQYAFRYPVDETSVGGSYDVAFVVTDEVGNISERLGGTDIVLDVQGPTLGLVTVNAARFSTVAGFREVVVQFDASESLDVEPAVLEVSLAARSLACDAFRAVSPSYTCRRTLDGTEPEGLATILVEAADAVGNGAFTAATVTLDFTGPEVVWSSVVWELVPSLENVQAQPTMAAAGTTVRVQFSVTEPLVQDPDVWAEGRPPMAFAKEAGGGLLFAYARQISADDAPGDYQLRMFVVDDVGNWRDAVLRWYWFTADLAAPTAPAVESPNAVTYVRRPWGVDGGSPSFALELAVGAVEGGSLVIAYAGVPVTSALEIGRGVADGNGAIAALPLQQADRSHVYVVAYDAAGNASPAVLVRDVVWSATMGGKIAGSPQENPHTFEAWPWFDGRLYGSGAIEQGAGSGIAAPGGAVLSTSSGGTWRASGYLTTPLARFDFGYLFDAARGRLVINSGCVSERCASVSDTWAWSGHRWALLPADTTTSDGIPRPRRGAQMAYDVRRDVWLMVGGAALAGATWESDGSRWTRFNSTNLGTRTGHALAFDAARNVSVLYGGNGASAEHWEWNDGVWTRLSAAAAPGARINGRLVVVDDGLLLFGGGAADPAPWRYDGVSWIREASSGPAPTSSTALAVYDDANDRVVLVGGADAADASRVETTFWGAGVFTRVAPTDPEGDGDPEARTLHSLAYDPGTAQVLLFGGQGLSDTTRVLADLWVFDGQSWRRVAPADPEGDGHPESRAGEAMSSDSTRHRVVLFGGSGPAGCDGGSSDLCSGTWEWNGASWNLALPPASGPEGRQFHAMAFGSSGDTLLFGGRGAGSDCAPYCRTTWAYNGSSWQQVAAAAPASPPQRNYHAMAYHQAAGHVLLFGGVRIATFDDAWLWQRGAWTQVPRDSPWPSARRQHAMGYDPGRQRIVLFGGVLSNNSNNETWEWDGARFERKTPTDPEGDGDPSPRAGARLLYDARRASMLLVSGDVVGDSCDGSGSSYCEAPWEWNGTSWAKLLVTDPDRDGVEIYPDNGYAMLPEHGHAIALADQTDVAGWLWHDGAGVTAAHVFTAALDRAMASADILSSLSLRWTAGGSGPVLDGTTLLGWYDGRWQTLASLGFASVSLGSGSWSSVDARILSALRVGPRGLLHFAVRPQDDNGARPSGRSSQVTIITDYVELVARYRLAP